MIPKNLLAAAFTFCVLSLTVLTTARAAIRTWDGSANGNLSTAANWSSGVAPVNGDDLVFPASGVSRFNVTNNFLGGPRFRSITFEGNGFTLYGAFLVLSNGIGSQNVAGVNRINCAITLAPTRRSSSTAIRARCLTSTATWRLVRAC